MSYQVLARKWRPRFFREMVGQEHVLKALINALDHNRLHHAYLFTGTRGVGKTTIARILAKCLNCEVGVSSEPCGQCSSCLEIAQGSFVDLIEVDAASRTKVEDTRELLDNVQYAPTKGRFKVYLIDEVHMLSTHSFNALLKTLEEPPEHVKFLLATTDPQKIPATILSRCLQFHLKNMSPERIVGHLNHVLTQEVMEFDEQALWALARSASGSMRDALSLTDQAIAFGTGKVSSESVAAMLGSIDQNTVYELMQALIDYNADQLLDVVAQFSEHAPDYSGVLDELLLLMHRMTIAHVSAAAVDNSEGDKEKVIALAAKLSAEELQLFYQMGLIAKRDLGLAPDLRTGFEMGLLRMLAFRPQGVSAPALDRLPSSLSSTDLSSSGAGVQETVKKPEAAEVIQQQNPQEVEVGVVLEEQSPQKVPTEVLNESLDELSKSSTGNDQLIDASANDPLGSGVGRVDKVKPLIDAGVSSSTQAVHGQGKGDGEDEDVHLSVAPIHLPQDHAAWLESFECFEFNGLVKSVASEMVLINVSELQTSVELNFLLNVERAQLFNDRHRSQIKDVLSKFSSANGGQLSSVLIEPLAQAEFLDKKQELLSLRELQDQNTQQALAHAQAVMAEDEVMKVLVNEYDAEVIDGSIRSIH